MALCAQNRQAAIDAPNLDFSMGFVGWERKTGTFVCDDKNVPDPHKTYHYEWDDELASEDRIITIGDNGTLDPIIPCNLIVNPDPGKVVARLGIPNKAEQNGWSRGPAAEKLSYTYKITQATSVLKYRFAAVLNIPELSSVGTIAHVGAE